jgi:hypothetical protein
MPAGNFLWIQQGNIVEQGLFGVNGRIEAFRRSHNMWYRYYQVLFDRLLGISITLVNPLNL